MANIAYVSYILGGTPVTYSPYTDDFSSALGDFWQNLPVSHATASVTGGFYQVALDNAGTTYEYAGICNATPVNLVNGSVSAQIDVGSASGAVNALVGIQICGSVPGGDPTQTLPWIRIAGQSGALWCGWGTNPGGTSKATPTYNGTNHKYMQISESDGTLYWKASSDGSSWSTIVSASVASSPFSRLDLTSVYTQLVTYTWGGYNTTGKFTDYAYTPFETGEATIANASVSASVVILDSDNSVVASTGDAILPDQITADFNYGDSVRQIHENLAGAVREAAADYTLEVVFV